MTTGLLAVIDMQRAFGEPGSPWATPRFAEAAAGVRRLLPAFAERVTFTRFVAPGRPTGAWREYYARWPFALQPPDAPLWRLTDEFADGPRTSWTRPRFPPGPPVLFVAPRSAWTVLDDWRGALGLRGTGSNSIRMDQALGLPQEHIALIP